MNTSILQRLKPMAVTATVVATAGSSLLLGASSAQASPVKERTIKLNLALVRGTMLASGRVGGDYGRGTVIIQKADCNQQGKKCGAFKKFRTAKTDAQGRFRLPGLPIPWCKDDRIAVRAAVPAKGGQPRSNSSAHVVCKYVK